MPLPTSNKPSPASVRAQAVPSVEAEPLDGPAFAQLMARLGPFERRPELAVALSGGPDSLALCLLADGWARARDGRVVALTVDHGLRDDSRAEALTVGRWLETRGIEHHILTWQGTKPPSAIQARAREARYALLLGACRARGLLHLLLGHHRDDLVETVAMRVAHSSGPGGRAGMAPVREEGGVRLLRPLLGVTKPALIAVLLRFGQPWIDDPSNRALRFERNRLRAAGQLPVTRLLAERDLRARCRHEDDLAVATWLARHARIDPLGWLDFPRDALDGFDLPLARAVLSRALLTIGGALYPPRSENLERLRAALGRPGRSFGRTLAGCTVGLRRGRVQICREPVAVTDQVLLSGDADVRFDGRFDIRVQGGRGLTLRRLGLDGRTQARHLLRRIEPPRPLPRMAAASLPALFDADTVVAVPQDGLIAEIWRDRLWIETRHRPRHPLAGPPFPPVTEEVPGYQDAAPLHARTSRLF